MKKTLRKPKLPEHVSKAIEKLYKAKSYRKELGLLVKSLEGRKRNLESVELEGLLGKRQSFLKKFYPCLIAFYTTLRNEKNDDVVIDFYENNLLVRDRAISARYTKISLAIFLFGILSVVPLGVVSFVSKNPISKFMFAMMLSIATLSVLICVVTDIFLSRKIVTLGEFDKPLGVSEVDYFNKASTALEFDSSQQDTKSVNRGDLQSLRKLLVPYKKKFVSAFRSYVFASVMISIALVSCVVLPLHFKLNTVSPFSFYLCAVISGVLVYQLLSSCIAAERLFLRTKSASFLDGIVDKLESEVESKVDAEGVSTELFIENPNAIYAIYYGHIPTLWSDFLSASEQLPVLTRI